MKFILLILLFTMMIFAQVPERNQLSIFPQSLMIDSYNSIGFSNMNLSTISDISSANPASLYQFENISFGMNYLYLSKTKLYSDITITSSKTRPPVAFGFVYPINNFRLGVAYHQKYNSYLDFGKIEITTIENPEGTGEFFNSYSERIIHSPSLLSNYTFNSILGDDNLSIGLQVFWDFLKTEEKIYNTKGYLEGNSFSWKVGVLYEYKKETYLSCVYEKGNKLESEFEMENELTFVDIDEDGNRIAVKPKYFMKLPDKLSLGITVDVLNKLILSMSVSSVFWESVNDSYKNNLDLSASTIFKLNQSLMFSLGFYNSGLNEKTSGYFYSGLNYNSNFIGIGVNWRINNFNIVCELYDNNLYSSEIRKQTQIKLGLNYTLN